MDTTPAGPTDPTPLVNRRTIIKGAAWAATGMVAGSVAAACAAPRAGWTFDPRSPAADLSGASPTPTAEATAVAGHTMDTGTAAPETAAPGSAAPASAMPSHDDEAKAV